MMSINLQRIKRKIASQNRKNPLSGVLAIVEGRELIYARGFGYANRADRLLNRPNTRFGIASGTKTFTSLAICQLVERGLVSFDTRLKDCLDISFPMFDPQITLHHLLTHSSGIADYFDEEKEPDYEKLWENLPMYQLRRVEDFVPLFQNNEMTFSPGEKWYYNNTGYIVLGLVIEHLTGMRYQNYICENIFLPCGMLDSSFFALDALPERTAYGYIKTGENSWRTNIYSIPVVGGPDGGAFVTALDMVKFWDGFLDGHVMSKPGLEKMFYPYFSTGDDLHETFYGYGVWLKRNDGKITSIYMLGEDPGSAFISAYFPEKETVLTILGNETEAVWPMRRCLTAEIKKS